MGIYEKEILVPKGILGYWFRQIAIQRSYYFFLRPNIQRDMLA